MNQKDYDKCNQRIDYALRIRKARAKRNTLLDMLWNIEHGDAGSFNNIRNRRGPVYDLLRKMRLERDVARAERDRALRTIARLAMQGVKIPVDES
jgi:hypothetical protein